MFRTLSIFSLVSVMVAMAASPCLAQVHFGDTGKQVVGLKNGENMSKGLFTDGSVRGISGKSPNNIITILIGLAKSNGGGTTQKGAAAPSGPVPHRLDKSSPLLLKGSPVKPLGPGPVPLKEQMKKRFKNRLKNGGN